ncbi:Tex family protein [Ascidiimonas aurantiaca]|uniref:Tex family protein n=1 Tax=Ascidiimonas aurantiaca TaxID=1685432 RepID=UPI003BB7DCE0
MSEIDFVKTKTGLSERSVRATLQLAEEGCTLPFIARYRKEHTGNLDELQIKEILSNRKKFNELIKRKEYVLKSIKEQGELSDVLRDKINAADTLTDVEDLYLPFRKSRNTRAAAAVKKGLMPLAKQIMAGKLSDPYEIAHKYVNKEVVNPDEALQGARDIIAQWISEDQLVRNTLRKLLTRKARIKSTLIKDADTRDNASKYQQYFDWDELLHKIPSHRLLAILRAEKEGIVRTKLVIDKEEALKTMNNIVIKTNMPAIIKEIRMALEDAYKRLLYPSLTHEVLKNAKEQADDQAIRVFSKNLRQLLLAPPLGEKRILAIDPGFKSGCKIVCLDQKGDLKHNENIYPHAPQRETGIAAKKIRSLVNAYKIEAIAIGNGTASRETEAFIKKIPFDRALQVFIVNESGASVYSASSVARKEFPQYDVTVRGAVSIGRRLADPLAELVKIDPKAIGVGQYQHDVDAAKLKNELDTVVSSCVNHVGVNVNTASAALLSYVSGLGPVLADAVLQYRKENGSFQNREQLLQVPRLGPKAYEQCAAFLRVKQGTNALDNSAVHPESYPVVNQMADDLNVSVDELIGNKELLCKITPENYCTQNIGLPTIADILVELEKPGLDPRQKAKVFEFSKELKRLEDVKVGSIVPGIVNNITNFGCFVDIGIKESGLVHISNMSKKFISNPGEIVSLHEHVMVKVLELDPERKRIQLALLREE